MLAITDGLILIREALELVPHINNGRLVPESKNGNSGTSP